MHIGSIAYRCDADGWTEQIGDAAPTGVVLADVLAAVGADTATRQRVVDRHVAMTAELCVARNPAAIDRFEELADLASRLDATALAEYAGEKARGKRYSPQWIRNALSQGYAPEPVERLGGSPSWTRMQVDRWLERRPGRGWRAQRPDWTPPPRD